MAKTILFGERVEKIGNNNGWKTLYDSGKENPKVNSENLLKKKSIIVLPGDGTMSERDANGTCKTVQNMLIQSGLSGKEMPHIYGLAYADGSQDNHRYQVLTQVKQNKFGTDMVSDKTAGKPYYQPFFDEYILPLITDEKGNPRSASEIKKNLQNITFVSHCHGGFVAYQIEKMISEKLVEFYPQKMKDLMANMRMIHFASRRPKGQLSLAKHFDIISQNDSEYADTARIEYDDIHKQIHRVTLKENSALIPTSQNESILVIKQLTNGESEDVNQDADHSQILSIFSGQQKNLFKENESSIQLVQQLLRHFVEHPDDKRDLIEQLKTINPDFVQDNLERGKSLLTEEKSDENLRRSKLSLISEWGDKWGAHMARRKKHYSVDFGQKHFDHSPNDFLLQRDEKGMFLYNNLFKQYQKTGDSRSLISFIKDVGSFRLPQEDRGSLALLSIENKDWSLFKTLNENKGNSFYVSPKQLPQIVSSVSAQDLYRLLGLLKVNTEQLKKQPETIMLLKKKIKEIKKVLHKQQLESFMKDTLESVFYLDKPTFRTLLKQSNMKEKASLKSLLSNARQKQADKLMKKVRQRDAEAPDLTVKELKEYENMSRQYSGATIKDILKFRSLSKENPKFTFDQYMMNKKQQSK